MSKQSPYEDLEAGVPKEAADSREETRRRKLENEQRRSMIWRSEGMEGQQAQVSPPAAAVPPSPVQSPPNARLGSFLNEKQQIAGRSLRRMSSRRSSQRSFSSDDSNRSRETTVSEKTAISERSNRRIKMRQTSRSMQPQPEEVEHDLSGLAASDPISKAGTAEAILPTVSEMEMSQRSDSTAPSLGPGMAFPPGENLVMAELVSDDSDEEDAQQDMFVNDIAYATEVTKTEEQSPCRRRIPALLCCALVFLVAFNVGVVVLVLQTRSNDVSSTDSVTGEDASIPSAIPPIDQDDPTQPIVVPSVSPNVPPTPRPPTAPDNNGRPPDPSLDNGRPKDKPTMAPTVHQVKREPPAAPSTGDVPLPVKPFFAPSRSPSMSAITSLPSQQPTSAPTTVMPTMATDASSLSKSPSNAPTSSLSELPTFGPVIVIGRLPTVNTTDLPWTIPPANDETNAEPTRDIDNRQGADGNGNGNGNSNGNANGNSNGNGNGQNNGRAGTSVVSGEGL